MSGYRVRPRGRIEYKLPIPRLDKLSISGSGNLKSERLYGENLTLGLSGSGSASIRSMTYKSLAVSISGNRAALVRT